MLAARSVCYSQTGASGVYAAGLMDRLGIGAGALMANLARRGLLVARTAR